MDRGCCRKDYLVTDPNCQQHSYVRIQLLSIQGIACKRESWIKLAFLKGNLGQKLKIGICNRQHLEIDLKLRWPNACGIMLHYLSSLKGTFLKRSNELVLISWIRRRYDHNVIKLGKRVADGVWGKADGLLWKLGQFIDNIKLDCCYHRAGRQLS